MAAGGTTQQGPGLVSRIAVEQLDHLVLTVRDVEATIAFYRDVLGIRCERSDDGRRALHVGSQKLVLQEHGHPAAPSAAEPTTGSAELCFVTATPVEGLLRLLGEHGIEVMHGPAERAGATGQLLSVYVRDPDGNLVELANRLDA